MFAIIRTGGKQYRVQEGDRIAVELLEADEGADVTFEDVLLVGSEGDTRVGAPTVAGASVTGRVESQGQAKKVIFFEYKNKTRQKRMLGHRQQETRVLITGISAG
ncbi:MAG: 50S ribosomal protein L21 [Dehalococcoidia bacterium]|nr:50S ribosomal protein L21 [Dehalococcoidia bacterium]